MITKILTSSLIISYLKPIQSERWSRKYEKIFNCVDVTDIYQSDICQNCSVCKEVSGVSGLDCFKALGVNESIVIYDNSNIIKTNINSTFKNTDSNSIFIPPSTIVLLIIN